MRKLWIIGSLALIWISVAAIASAGSLSSAANRPVVVELFTSQGCSSCPPADAYLAELAEREDVIALEFHVDYWDYIGWKDPFANPAYTARQRAYAANLDQRYVYTPQMVVDGLRHEVGSRREAVEMAIKLARQEKPDVAPRAVLMHDADGVTVEVEGERTSRRPFDLVLVSFDRRHETDVPRGENAGRSMANVHVVRSMETIGAWDGGRIRLSVPDSRLPGDGGCAILVQEKGGGRILAAALLPFGKAF